MQQKIDGDIKIALLGGDKQKAEILKNLKSALIYEAGNLGVKDSGLSDEQAQKILAKEAKKRAEAALVYEQAGETQRAAAESLEKRIIESYLPEQMDEQQIQAAVDAELVANPIGSASEMGKTIGAVKGKLGPSADGATIARLVKQSLES